ncbi:hypothetical protein [Frankia sp. AgKG'84/4]|uniref:hypothetical protein n=1 Tax=Frankia sp. AgKG'84/4 TaxID=573490 RepID=UPI00200C4020|nr:hypothetical protein [Frankia sp. AgKG'84/4]MCL9797333.1 hypothetical protein [Frankia sp. AgKG'84/4]
MDLESDAVPVSSSSVVSALSVRSPYRVATAIITVMIAGGLRALSSLPRRPNITHSHERPPAAQG